MVFSIGGTGRTATADIRLPRAAGRPKRHLHYARTPNAGNMASRTLSFSVTKIRQSPYTASGYCDKSYATVCRERTAGNARNAGKPMACNIATKSERNAVFRPRALQTGATGMFAQNDSDNKANTPQFTTNRRNS